LQYVLVQEAVIFGYDEDGGAAAGLAPGAARRSAGDLSKEEEMMANRRLAIFKVAFLLVFFTMLFQGCAERQAALRDQVTTEYLLTKAGFTTYKPNMETPRTQALLDALPGGQITTFTGNGTVYHAYPDKMANTLYIGDAAAYQKYAALAQGRNLCQRVDAPNSAGFWSCFQELQGAAARTQGR